MKMPCDYCGNVKYDQVHQFCNGQLYCSRFCFTWGAQEQAMWHAERTLSHVVPPEPAFRF